MVEIFGSCGYNKKEHEQEARNMYEYDSRVRLSEVDQHQRMTLNAVLNYFQDCSSFHSEDLGVGIEYLNDGYRAHAANEDRGKSLRSIYTGAGTEYGFRRRKDPLTGADGEQRCI